MPQFNDSNAPTEEFEQYILNNSYDQAFRLLMTGLLAYNSTDNRYDRVQITADGKLKVDAAFSGTVTSAPTFKLDPSNSGETPKYGKVDTDGIVQTADVNYGTTSPGNSYNATIASTATFTGTPQLWGPAQRLDIIIHTTIAGSLFVDFYDDTLLIVRRTIEAIPVGTGGRFFSIPAEGDGFAVRYVNGTGSATLFLESRLFNTQISPKYQPIEVEFTEDTSVIPVHGIISGRTSAGGGGFVDVKVNPSGSLETAANLAVNGDEVTATNPVPVYTTDVLEKYRIADQATGTTNYYGFTDKDANWYILQENTVTGTYRYATPAIQSPSVANYPAAWTGRTGLDYGYLYEAF